MRAQKRRKQSADEEAAALDAVLADLEAEHGQAGPHHASSSAADPRALVTYDDLDLSDAMRKRRLDRKQSDAPEGFVYDEKSGFYWNEATGYYYERTPERELYCHAATGRWVYFDLVAKEYRPFPDELLTPAERAIARPAPASAPASAPAPAAAATGATMGRGAEPSAAPPSAPPAAALALPDASRRTAISFSTAPRPKTRPTAGACAAEPTAAAQGGAPAQAGQWDLADWEQFACLLCQRQFSGTEALQRHISFSKLHQENLAQRTS